MAYLEAHSDCVRGHDENLLREIYYSHVGGFDQRWAAAEAGHWLDELRPNRALFGDASCKCARGGPSKLFLSEILTCSRSAAWRSWLTCSSEMPRASHARLGACLPPTAASPPAMPNTVSREHDAFERGLGYS